jgi:plasmid stability protein
LRLGRRGDAIEVVERGGSFGSDIEVDRAELGIPFLEQATQRSQPPANLNLARKGIIDYGGNRRLTERVHGRDQFVVDGHRDLPLRHTLIVPTSARTSRATPDVSFPRPDCMQCACYGAERMANLQVRNVPEELHRALKARAAQMGMSLSDYALIELRRAAERPTREEVLARIAGRPRPKLRESPADIIRAARDDR